MSIVAEFATALKNSEPKTTISTNPITYPARVEVLKGVRAVIFDIYGTLIHYWNDRFSHPDDKQAFLQTVFRKTADRFNFTDILIKIDPEKAPEETLANFYHGLILMKHEELQKRGKNYPEVEIEQIWNVILSILINNGYDFDTNAIGTREETARCIAYFYNYHALERGFFEGVVDALATLKKQGMKLGIVSNAQFYTPLDLSFFIREQSDMFVDYLELFDSDLIFFSFEYSVAKPNPLLFRKLYDALYEIEVLPENTVFVGNDLIQDVKAAQEAGMKTALFTGHQGSLFLHGEEGSVVPDVAFDAFEKLPHVLEFHEGSAAN